MVSKKIKSKRKSTAQRAKITRKVNEHKRKVKKEAKKHPELRKRVKKDPGIPNNLPFKDKLLKDIEHAKERVRLDKEKRWASRLRAQNPEDVKMKDNDDVSINEQDQLVSLIESAEKQTQIFESHLEKQQQVKDSELTCYKFSDHSRKAYFKEFRKVVELSDVVLEVLDARDPLGCRVRQVEEMILESGLNKRLILILNKADLIPVENLSAWLQYLKNEFPVIGFTSSSDSSKKHSQKEAYNGGEELIQLLKNYCRNANLKTSITVGVVGFPNVGKSSLINALKRSKACPVGSTPGITKHSQLIHLDSNIKLLDSPGIVFTSGCSDLNTLLLRNCLKVEQLEDVLSPIQLIVSKCSKEQLMILYSIGRFDDHLHFLSQVSKKLGKLKKGGLPDIDATAKAVLKDWNSGKIPFYTVPPSRNHEQLGAKIVDTWSKEFDLSSIENNLTGLLSSHQQSKKMAYIPLESSEMITVDALISDPSMMEDDPQNTSTMMSETESLDQQESLMTEEEEENTGPRYQMKPMPLGSKLSSYDYDSKRKILQSLDSSNKQINQDKKRALKKEKKKKNRMALMEDDDHPA